MNPTTSSGNPARPADTALREVTEETGVRGRLVEKLGDVRYVYVWEGERVFKVVSFYLVRYSRGRLGAIAPGMQADLALFTLDEPRFSGAQDPIAALALCGAHRADRVMVAGRWRVIDGQPEDVDLPALIAKHKAAARAFA